MRVEIRELRDRTGMSQSEFADTFGIPVSTYRKWEQGDADPAPYLVTLLARQIAVPKEQTETVRCKDGSVFYYDPLGQTLSDAKGTRICLQESLDGVKRQNLPFYVKDLFDSYYEIMEKFRSDCSFDRKEDFIWS